MLTKNINNNTSFGYNSVSQKKKMKIHKKLFLTLATSLIFTVNYGNSYLFSAVEVHEIGVDSNIKLQQLHLPQVHLKVAKVKVLLGTLLNKTSQLSSNLISETEAQKLWYDLYQSVRNARNINKNISIDTSKLTTEESKIVNIVIKKSTTILHGMWNIEDTKHNAKDKLEGLFQLLNNTLNSFTPKEEQVIIDYVSNNGGVNNKIIDLLEDVIDFIGTIDITSNTEDPEIQAKIKEITKDPEIQATIKEIKEIKEQLKIKKPEEALKKSQKIIDQQNRPEVIKVQENRPEVIKVQEKLQIAQAAIAAQTYTVRNITVVQSSIVSNITDTRMNINQYAIRASEDENKPVAAGSQTIAPYITSTSWDIWASGHMGNIKQDVASDTSTNSKTNFYGGTIGIDKIFANNSVFGLALSYGKSNTEYKSKTGNEKWASNYYQANAYIHHNFTDNLFVQLIGGAGTYGDGTTIGNMFDFSSQKSIFGYHGNATVGYSIFGGEDNNFVITPQLGVGYHHLNIPDSILSKTDSSTFTTLGRFDGIAGLNIKILNLNSNSNSNVKIIPEITAAFKLRISDNVAGINADNIKLPVVKSTNSNDLSANALATPEQLFTLGGALTVVTNNNFSINLNGSVDFAKQYFAMVGGISVKLSF